VWDKTEMHSRSFYKAAGATFLAWVVG